MIPEDLLCLLEENVVKEKGEEGKSFLYFVGKCFGYHFGSVSLFPNIKNKNYSEEEIKILFLDFLKLIKNIWGEELITTNLSFDNKKVEFQFKNFVVFRKNGLGYFICDGAGTGLFDFFVDDDKCEGVRTVLNKKEFLVDVSYTDFYLPVREYALDLKESSMFNKIVIVNKNSLKELLNSGFVTYKRNSFFVGDSCFFQCDISLLYILEFEFNNKGWNDLLFNSAFNFSKNLFSTILNHFSTKNEKLIFASNFLTVLGLGDVDFLQDKVVCRFFPFHSLARKIDFDLFRGIFSGVLSCIFEEDFILKKHSVFISDSLTIEFEK
jgi:hypothetical protein